MLKLFDTFLDIGLFRKGPQDLPASKSLLQLTLLLYAGSGFLVLAVGASNRISWLSALALTAFDIALLAGLGYLGLLLFGYGSRALQTLSALTGVGSLLQFVALPLVLWVEQAQLRNSGATLPILLWLMLLIWSIAVMAHILQQAFSTSRMIGTFCALGYLIISWTITDFFLPTGA